MSFSILQNVGPDANVAPTALQDELAIINIEWQQAYNDIAQTLKTSKDNNQALNSALLREFNYVIELLMADMIRTVVGQSINVIDLINNDITLICSQYFRFCC